MRRSSVCLWAFSILFSASSAWSETVAVTPETQTACVLAEAVDATTPEVRALLANLLSIKPAGGITVQKHENRTAASQTFDIVDEQGQPVKVTVTCSSGDCASPCHVTGCNPTTYNNEPACTAVVCRTSSGSPCGVQTTCTKTAAIAAEPGGGTIDNPIP